MNCEKLYASKPYTNGLRALYVLKNPPKAVGFLVVKNK